MVAFRFSAMGDVALTLATFATVINENPELEITIVTRKKFAVFFENYPQIKVFPVDFEGKHKNPVGLFRLFRELKKERFDAVLDLHQNLRTAFLKFCFLLSGNGSYTINKGRTEKKKLVKGKIFHQLKHSCERYLDVFKAAELINENIQIQNHTPFFKPSLKSIKTADSFLAKLNSKKIIGIAPFAQHIGKQWPLEKFQTLISMLNKQFPDFEILVFGGGKKEEQEINSLKGDFTNMVGKFSLEEELAIIKKLDVFISGDTSNMHFAWMSGIPTLSIWGVTHRFAGFGPLFQDEQNIIEASKETLPCRPCSVYGKTDNQECIEKSMGLIESDVVFERVKAILM